MEGLIESLRNLSRQAQAVARELCAYNRLLSDPVGNAHNRATLLAGLKQSISEMPESIVRARLEEWHTAEVGESDKAKTEFRFQFGRSLVAGLEGSGLGIKGQLPLLRVGMFTVRADFDRGTATVFWGPEVEKLKAGMKLEPAELARTLRAWSEKLAGRGIAPDRLVRSMYEAYRRRCRLEDLADGTRLFLVDLLAELVLLIQPESFRLNPSQAKFVEYPRVRFSYDLYRLRQAAAYRADDMQMKLHVANFDATTEKSKALWVPDNDSGDGTHYSYVSFARAE
jgi:hypothetical protein